MTRRPWDYGFKRRAYFIRFLSAKRFMDMLDSKGLDYYAAFLTDGREGYKVNY